MSHYSKQSGSPESWWLDGIQFRLHGTLKNASQSPNERVEVELEIGPYWLADNPDNDSTSIESDDLVSLVPKTTFLIDTGAEVSVLKGMIAKEFFRIAYTDGSGAKFTVANGESTFLPYGWLSVKICGRWKKIKFGFWLPELQKERDDYAILGMDGILFQYLLSISSEYVDVFRRQYRKENLAMMPLMP